MDIQAFSKKYRVVRLRRENIPAVLRLCEGNPQYYRFCPPPVSGQSICRDMEALPPGIACSGKYYVGFYQEDALIAVMDVIDGYPQEGTVYIGFFMLESGRQRQGEATAIITDCCAYWRAAGRRSVRLGYARGNLQAEAFWARNQFRRLGSERPADGYTGLKWSGCLEPARRSLYPRHF